MDDDFDILSLLIEEKTRAEVISESIDKVCSNPIQLMTESEIKYSVDKSEFKDWLEKKGFIEYFETDETLNLIDMNKAVSQAAVSFINYGDEF